MKEIKEMKVKDAAEYKRDKDEFKRKMKEHKLDFIKRWVAHSRGLSDERRETIERSLEASTGAALRNIGYRYCRGPWVPISDRQLAIWNGNPYADGEFKQSRPIYLLYDYIDTLTSKVQLLETALAKKEIGGCMV